MRLLVFVQDPASIPEVVGPFITISYSIAYMLMPLFFTFAIVTEMSKGLKDLNEDRPPQYVNIIFRTVGIVLALILYRTIFLSIVAVCQVLSMYMFSMDRWSELQTVFSRAREEGFLGILRMSPNTILVVLLTTFVSIIEYVFNLVRYMLLALFYILGPIIFAMAIWPGKGGVLAGWFKNLFTIAAWIIVLRALQGVFISILFASQITMPDNLGDVVFADFDRMIISVVFIIMVIITPSLTGMLLSGEGLGHIGSIIMAGVKMVAAKLLMPAGAAASAGSMVGVGAGLSGGLLRGIGGLTNAIGITKHGGAIGKVGQSLTKIDESIKKTRISPKQEPGK